MPARSKRPKAIKAWAIMDESAPFERGEYFAEYFEVWIGAKPEPGPGERLERIEVRPLARGKKKTRKA